MFPLAEVTSGVTNTMTTITDALSTSLTSMSSDILGVLAVVIPSAIGIAAAVFGVRKGMSWFKSLAK